MVEFLTTHAMANQIEQVMLTARREIYLISPFLQLSQTLLDRMRDAAARRVNITIVYGKSDLTEQERKKVAGLDRLKLYFLQNLHAKCYKNEDLLVIGSMNMYEFSEKTNREMGVLVRRSESREVFRAAEAEIESLIRASNQIDSPVPENRRHKGDRNRRRRTPTGHCIRCRDEIPYDRDSPYCSECHAVWVQFDNWRYVENYCHKCGREEGSSKIFPLCDECFYSEPSPEVF